MRRLPFNRRAVALGGDRAWHLAHGFGIAIHAVAHVGSPTGIRRVSSAAGLGLVVACLLLGCSTFVPAPTVKAPESLLAARLGGVLGGLGLSLKSGAAWAVTEGYEDYNNIKERMLAKSVPQEIEKAASKGPDMTAATTVGGAGFFILVALAGIVILLVSGKRDTTIRDQANGKRG
ncbi:unnamed protein product [Polarella glacialis]|uniref:Uncharacterized protein n=1 Tax=Polarella glacialis TaxID=89957 RepID=A0A813KDG1_POLGL|nr:unnamed protein product [Polarella glacialis]